MNITIIGGGAGGLFAALLLARAGHEVTVLEQEPGRRRLTRRHRIARDRGLGMHHQSDLRTRPEPRRVGRGRPSRRDRPARRRGRAGRRARCADRRACRAVLRGTGRGRRRPPGGPASGHPGRGCPAATTVAPGPDRLHATAGGGLVRPRRLPRLLEAHVHALPAGRRLPRSEHRRPRPRHPEVGGHGYPSASRAPRPGDQSTKPSADTRRTRDGAGLRALRTQRRGRLPGSRRCWRGRSAGSRWPSRRPSCP